MKSIVAFLVLSLTFLVPAYSIHKSPDHKAKSESHVVNPQIKLEVDGVVAKPLTKRAIRAQKRWQRASKWIAKYAEASGENRVVAAALLAFFIGALGIHRVYLGGNGLLILGYIFTIGGLFGILPLIDFIRIVSGGIDHYEGNDALFAAFQSFGT